MSVPVACSRHKTERASFSLCSSTRAKQTLLLCGERANFYCFSAAAAAASARDLIEFSIAHKLTNRRERKRESRACRAHFILMRCTASLLLHGGADHTHKSQLMIIMALSLCLVLTVPLRRGCDLSRSARHMPITLHRLQRPFILLGDEIISNAFAQRL
jgi:hypothetical protein